MKRRITVAIIAVTYPLLGFATATAQGSLSGWPQWRGPLGTGVSPDADPPVTWSESDNLRFKVSVDGEGLASPVVWEEKIFLLTTISEDPEGYDQNKRDAQSVLERREWPPAVQPLKQRFIVEARSREDGSLIWSRTARTASPHESHYIDSSWASGSPITDGELVIAHFGSNGTYAYDLDGKLLWQKDLGDMTTRNGFGEGSSPAISGNTLVITWDHEGDSFIVALDKRTGEELWRTDRPGEVTSWATPLIVNTAKGSQVIVPGTGASRGYDLTDGREIWRLSGMSVNTIPTPVHRDGVVFLASGYRTTMMQAVALEGAQGDLAGTDAVRWTYERDTPYVASVLLYGDQLYFVKHFRNIFTALDINSGKAYYTQRLPKIRNVYASPLGAAGRIYLFGRGGESLVLRQGPTFEVLSENTLDDGIDATPAMVGEDLYIRGRHFLYGISKAPTAEK